MLSQLIVVIPSCWIRKYGVCVCDFIKLFFSLVWVVWISGRMIAGSKSFVRLIYFRLNATSWETKGGIAVDEGWTVLRLCPCQNGFVVRIIWVTKRGVLKRLFGIRADSVGDGRVNGHAIFDASDIFYVNLELWIVSLIRISHILHKLMFMRSSGQKWGRNRCECVIKLYSNFST
jgi:hypothetical protein